MSKKGHNLLKSIEIDFCQKSLSISDGKSLSISVGKSLLIFLAFRNQYWLSDDYSHAMEPEIVVDDLVCLTRFDI